MLDIRAASIADIPVIKEIVQDVWPKTYAPILSAEQIAYMMDMMYAQESLEGQMMEQSFLICYDGEQAVGFASYEEVEDGIYKLHKIYISSDKHGRGIGKELLNWIKEAIISKGAAILELNVNKYNSAAIQFYKKVGFNVYREEDIDIGNGYYMNDYVLRWVMG
jgi:diamine N-acetyltransferase